MFTNIDKRAVRLDYTNYKQVRSERAVIPLVFFFGSTEHHEEDQWLILAFDVDKQEERTFAMKDIHSWKPL